MKNKRLLEQLYIASKIGITSKENEKILKDYYKVVLKDLDRLEKLEKAIKILKDKFDIKISHTIEDIPIIIISLEETGEWYCIDISEEQYELLKEVLGND